MGRDPILRSQRVAIHAPRTARVWRRMYHDQKGEIGVSDIKRLLQSIYDDHMFAHNKEVIEQVICGKKNRYFLPQDNQDQQQWQQEMKDNE